MSEPVLELRSICKTYPGVMALDDVTLAVKPGEVLGLIGENGAGKSTLMKIVGGVVWPTSGTVLIGGVERSELTVKDATLAGVAFVHQELNLFDNLDVAANVLIGREPRWGGFLKLVDKGALRSRVSALLQRLGMEFGADELVENLSIAQRQMVEIGSSRSSTTSAPMVSA
jgi:ribose transport system ATP-binding protein